jgi:hypothetical protein
MTRTIEPRKSPRKKGTLKMTIFQNTAAARQSDCTTVAACRAVAAPGPNWIAADSATAASVADADAWHDADFRPVGGMQRLYSVTESGATVTFYGWL